MEETRLNEFDKLAELSWKDMLVGNSRRESAYFRFAAIHLEFR